MKLVVELELELELKLKQFAGGIMDILWTWKTYLHSLAYLWSLENIVWNILSRLA